MWLRFVPWRFLLRRIARSRGFIDPLEVLSQYNRFAEPADVFAPLALMRAGIILQARGLINSQAIQHNLDWVWPYWVIQQFNPGSPSFIPRAFSVSHINLTHRNWTAVGIPGFGELPIVDPRGLVTPLYNKWSLDCWIIAADGGDLVPSRLEAVSQRLERLPSLRVVTEAREEGLSLTSICKVEAAEAYNRCVITLQAHADRQAWLVVALRPYNTEGVSFIRDISLLPGRSGWLIDRKQRIYWNNAPQHCRFSRYHHGDVYASLREKEETELTKISCDVGMATAAAMFPLTVGETREVEVDVPLFEAHHAHHGKKDGAATKPRIGWKQALEGACHLELEAGRGADLFATALSTVVLHAPDDVYAGPYTYKRFWFRDAAIIAQAMACVGFTDMAGRIIDTFPRRQNVAGHFVSQEGEWDSNGQVLWVMWRWCQLTGNPPHESWIAPIKRAVRWIERKRLWVKDKPHAGLLSAGFSAEHLGPNDYYYWDNFWSVAGLMAAAKMFERCDERSRAERIRHDARAYILRIEESLAVAAQRLGTPAMPASPYRRLDSGAVGSIVAGYPLQLWAPDDPRLVKTADYLFDHCTFERAFFHDISHSGINPYLTLHIAQVLLRARDWRYEVLMERIAELASPTGQWPEAIHPRTGFGCMGDGQHVWAAAEWLMMMRNCFVYEEETNDTLVLCSGVPSSWCRVGGPPIRFGPAQTSYGPISITVDRRDRNVAVAWEGKWHHDPPAVEVALPGRAIVRPAKGENTCEIPIDE